MGEGQFSQQNHVAQCRFYDVVLFEEAVALNNLFKKRQ